MRHGWLAKAGNFTVEKIPCPDYGTVDESVPAKGVMHTTEGSWESALSEFRQKFAPTFMVGRDKTGRVRIAQLMPLGRMAGALKHVGYPPTNGWARVQIEIAGHSHFNEPWLPDAGVHEALSALMAELVDAAGIPLHHVPIRRNAEAWRSVSGWVGHVDVPHNDHVDPGSLNYKALFDRAWQIRHPAPPKPKRWRDWILVGRGK
jgi:hypothetical protein